MNSSMLFTYLGGNGNAQKVDEANVLIPDDFDLVNQSKSAQLVTQLLLRHILV